jgi:hypothetical protein
MNFVFKVIFWASGVRNSYSLVVGNSDVKDHIRDIGYMDNIKMDLKERGCEGCGLSSSGSG